jgi:hypothetical protein
MILPPNRAGARDDFVADSCLVGLDRAAQPVTDGVGALTSGSDGATLKLAGEAGFEPTPWR